jgi:hypothetical protein
MNQKLFFGIITIVSIAGIFVACGEGEINSFNADDQVAAIFIALDKDKAISACLADPVCKADYEAAENPPSSAQIPSSSSSVEPVISSSSISVPPLSSSPIIIASSSSVIAPSSSSIIVVSSSSIVPEGGIAGTCAPTPAVVELGDSVKWTFTKAATVDPKDIIVATFDWTFAAGSEPTFSGQGALGMTKTVSYNTSGSHTTTLSINGDAMTCAPVQVNGAPITECECTVDNPSPDVAAGGIANWSVTGCASTANITGYTWNGGALGDVLTTSHTFAAKGETFTPTLSVYNDDNTVQPVTCPAATAIDATKPPNLLTFAENKVDPVFIDVPNGACITVSGTWTDIGHIPPVKILCDLLDAQEACSMSMSYGTTSNSLQGSYSISNLTLELGKASSNFVGSELVCVEFTGGSAARCKLGLY